MKIAIQSVLGVAVLVLTYLIYDSINSKIQFEKETKRRDAFVVERLKDIRTAQTAYKTVKGEYASHFDSLINFVNNGRMPIVKQIGDADDSTAVAQGLVVRDTVYIPVKDTVFTPYSLGERVVSFNLDSLPYIPFSGGEKFTIAAGEIEKNRVKVKVFEISSLYSQIYKGMDVAGENVKLDEGLKVGSMTEPSTNGNWE